MLSFINNQNSSIEKSAFFVTYGGGHVAALAPIMFKLLAAGIPVLALALTTAKSKCKAIDVPSLSMTDIYRRVPGYVSARRIGQLLARNESKHQAVSLEETEIYLGVGFHAMVLEHGFAEAKQRYIRNGRQTFLPVDFFVKLFTTQRPSVVVATSAPRSERAALEAARILGIPSVCVVDLYAPFEIEWCSAPGYASRVCVLNDVVADRFRARGVPGERIAITGNPAFDRLYTLDYWVLRAKYRLALGLKESDRLVVWISQPEPSTHPFSGVAGDPSLPENVEKYLAAYFSDCTKVHIVMRLHPSEDRAPAVKGARIRYSCVTEPLDELLCASDLVITCSSTVGLEASMLGIPVIQSMDSLFSNDLPLADLGMAVAAPTYTSVGPLALEIISTENESQSKAKASNKTTPRSAATLISDLITDLLSN